MVHRGGEVGLMLFSDEYCPHCDNHFVIEAKTPQAALRVEGEDIRKDARFVFSISCEKVGLC